MIQQAVEDHQDRHHRTRINNNCTMKESRSRTNLNKSNTIFWTFFVVSLLALTANAFNLENRLPLTKFERAGSYFGYSVAEHVQTDEQDIKW